MPRGRLEFLVGASFAATELLQLTETFGLLHSHRRPFGFAGDANYSIAGLRKTLSCVRGGGDLKLWAKFTFSPYL